MMPMMKQASLIALGDDVIEQFVRVVVCRPESGDFIQVVYGGDPLLMGEFFKPPHFDFQPS